MAVPASQAGNSFRLNDFDVCSDFSKIMKETDSHFNYYALSADSSDESLHDSSFPTLWFFFSRQGFALRAFSSVVPDLLASRNRGISPAGFLFFDILNIIFNTFETIMMVPESIYCPLFAF